MSELHGPAETAAFVGRNLKMGGQVHMPSLESFGQQVRRFAPKRIWMPAIGKKSMKVLNTCKHPRINMPAAHVSLSHAS